MHIRRCIPGSFFAALLVVSGSETFANIAIGITTTSVGLEVATTGSASVLILPRDNTSNRPASAVNGMIRYNTTANAFEGYANGAWMQFAQQPVGSTANATASGPPVNANVYTPSSTTCSYSPAYGTCAAVTNGTWPVNGSNYNGCTNIPPGSANIVLDFGSNKTFGNFYISMYADGGYTALGVSFSVDNVTYTSSLNFYLTATSNTQYGSSGIAPSQVARYVRLTNLGANTYQNNNYFCQFAIGP